MMNSGGMIFMWLIGILVLILIVFGIGAIIKYLSK